MRSSDFEDGWTSQGSVSMSMWRSNPCCGSNCIRCGSNCTRPDKVSDRCGEPFFAFPKRSPRAHLWSGVDQPPDDCGTVTSPSFCLEPLDHSGAHGLSDRLTIPRHLGRVFRPQRCIHRKSHQNLRFSDETGCFTAYSSDKTDTIDSADTIRAVGATVSVATYGRIR